MNTRARVIGLIEKGLSNSQIAERLGITANSVGRIRLAIGAPRQKPGRPKEIDRL